jgi:histidyl-tRNA synthetase
VALQLARELRRAGVHVELAYKGDLGKRMKRANKVNARLAAIVGDAELERGVAMVRDLDSGRQGEVALAGLAARLSAN